VSVLVPLLNRVGALVGGFGRLQGRIQVGFSIEVTDSCGLTWKRIVPIWIGRLRSINGHVEQALNPRRVSRTSGHGEIQVAEVNAGIDDSHQHAASGLGHDALAAAVVDANGLPRPIIQGMAQGGRKHLFDAGQARKLGQPIYGHFSGNEVGNLRLGHEAGGAKLTGV
jgi:hypothetical protein